MGAKVTRTLGPPCYCFPSYPPTMSHQNQRTKKRKVLVVHDLLVNSEMANTQPGTAVFTTHSSVPSQGLFANLALNMHSLSRQLCRSVKRASDTALGVGC